MLKSIHSKLRRDFPHYLTLMRFDKPIGSLLLMWPTLCALWVASDGSPASSLVWIFSIGVIVMRSAGCVINDYADREFDPLVERTELRPLASGVLSPSQALKLFAILGLVALGLLLLLPMVVWPWAIPAMIFTIIYPYMKRYIQAPQAVLGIAFSFSIPMVYVACAKTFDAVFWLMLIINFCWVIAYDTAYAMSDKEDDLKIGVKSTAILFGKNDKRIIGVLQFIVLIGWLLVMVLLGLSVLFLLSLCIAGGMFAYQQWLIKERDRQRCFQAFLNNGWVGAIIWFGIISTF